MKQNHVFNKNNYTKKNTVDRIQGKKFSRLSFSPLGQFIHLQNSYGHQTLQRLYKSGIIQAGLKLSQPGDKYEQEADRIADQVMRMGDLQSGERAGNKSTRQQNEGLTREEQPAGSSVGKGIRSITSGGRPLRRSEKDFFEPRFGTNFSDVTLYTGSQAAQTAEAVNAHAYTIGNRIIFKGRNYGSERAAAANIYRNYCCHQGNFFYNEQY